MREVRCRLAYDGLSDAFFVSEQGRHVHYMALYRVFQHFVKTARALLPNPVPHVGPR